MQCINTLRNPVGRMEPFGKLRLLISAAAFLAAGLPAYSASDQRKDSAASSREMPSPAEIEILFKGVTKPRPRLESVSANDDQVRPLRQMTRDGSDTEWNHNNSRMSLQMVGDRRIFTYLVPRRRMQQAGWRSGDTLFEGQVIGDRWEGKAWVNSLNCGPLSYAVSGEMAADGQTVKMRGTVDRRDPKTCKVIGQLDDTLVFELIN
jgi:hypothetical protein